MILIFERKKQAQSTQSKNAGETVNTHLQCFINYRGKKTISIETCQQLGSLWVSLVPSYHSKMRKAGGTNAHIKRNQVPC